jgi:23S rRNA pseudouridine1911/1915/1917 synthase
VFTCHADAPDAHQALLSYRTLSIISGGIAHLEIRLETGRKHQIRVQLAAHQCPVLGDRKYGSRQPFPRGIALHARMLQFSHPIGNAELQLTAPLPPDWSRYVPAAGGHYGG